MATKQRIVSNDTPSEIVHEMRRQLNALVELIDSGADLAAIKSGISDGDVRKVVTDPELPTPPRRTER